MKKILLALSVLTVVIAGCKKDKDTSTLTLTLQTPVEGATYTDSVVMSFSVTSDNGLHSCECELAVSGGTLYLNNFLTGTGVHGLHSFSPRLVQDVLPLTLTPAEFRVTVVDLNNQTVTKIVNCNVMQ